METAAHEGRVYEGDRSIKAAALFEAATGLKRSLLHLSPRSETHPLVVLRGSLSLAAPGAEPATSPTAVDSVILRPGVPDHGPVEGYLLLPHFGNLAFSHWLSERRTRLFFTGPPTAVDPLRLGRRSSTVGNVEGCVSSPFFSDVASCHWMYRRRTSLALPKPSIGRDSRAQIVFGEGCCKTCAHLL